jgi:hypothetical protein
MTPEKKFERDLIADLQGRGCFAHHIDTIGCDGFPDLLVLKDDDCLLLELKYMTSALRTEQVAFRRFLGLVNNFHEILEVVKLKWGYAAIYNDEYFSHSTAFDCLADLGAFLVTWMKHGHVYT